MTWGIKVTLPGKSMSSTNPKDFIINTDLETNGKIKFAYIGTAHPSGVSVGAGSYTDVSITHSLGYRPMIKLYCELTPGSGRWYQCPFAYISTEDTYISNDISLTYTTTSTLHFRIINNTGASKTVKYYYFIMGESAA